jgi:hypothetical protein
MLPARDSTLDPKTHIENERMKKKYLMQTVPKESKSGYINIRQNRH